MPATLSTPGYAAGKVASAVPLFPAAATTTTLRERAYAIAAATASSGAFIVKLMLITLAPWSAAQTIPSATAEAFPVPSAPITFTGITEQRQHVLVTPTALLERAAITPKRRAAYKAKGREELIEAIGKKAGGLRDQDQRT